MFKKKIWIVLTTYSFDESVGLHSFLNEQDALNFLKEDFMAEKKIDEEVNEWNVLAILEDDGRFASITDHFYDHNDTTEWRIIETFFDENGLEDICG